MTKAKEVRYGITFKTAKGDRPGPVFSCDPRHCWKFAKSILFDRGYSNAVDWDLTEFPPHSEPTQLARPASELGPMATITEADDHRFW